MEISTNGEGRKIVASLGDGREAGHLLWSGHGTRYPEIQSVWVRGGLRRQGLATEMLRRAREIDPRLSHSADLSDDGRTWMQAVGLTRRTAAVKVAIGGPLALVFTEYSSQRQQAIFGAMKAFRNGKVRPDPKERELRGCYTIPVGGLSPSGTPDRLVLVKTKDGGWLAVYAVVNHNYGPAEHHVPIWLNSKHAEHVHKHGAMGSTSIFRAEHRPPGEDLSRPESIGVHWTTRPLDLGYSHEPGWTRVVWHGLVGADDIEDATDRFGEGEVVVRSGGSVRLLGRTERLGPRGYVDVRPDPEFPMNLTVPVKGTRIASLTAAWSPFVPPPHLKVTSGGDAVPGGYNGYYVAWDKATGEKMGYLDYQSASYVETLHGVDLTFEDVKIAMVEVEPEHRRKGVASVLLDALRHDFPTADIDPGYSTADGHAWWSRVQGRVAKLATANLRFEHLRDHIAGEVGDYEPGERIDTLVAYDGATAVGHISWYSDTDHFAFGGVDALGVAESHQRQGVATALYRKAKQIEPALDPRITPWFTDDGEAWMRSLRLGGRTANMAHYAREWRWQAWAKRNGHGALIEKTSLPALRKAAQAVLADYGVTAALDIGMMAGGYSEGGLIDGVAHVRINADEKNLWNALHEVSHVVCDHMGMDALDSDHGPGFRRIFSEILEVHGGIDTVDIGAEPPKRTLASTTRMSDNGVVTESAKTTIPMGDDITSPLWEGNGIYEVDISRWSSTRCVALFTHFPGMGVFPIGWLTWDKDRHTIEGVYVNPDYRGKGIGIEMAKAAERAGGHSLKNDSEEYTREGLAWAKKHGIPKAKNTRPVSTSDMARMVGRMNNLLVGSDDLITKLLLKVG